MVASRTTNNAEGYTTNLRGTNIAKGKPTADVLGFLPNISRENGNFKINGLAVSEIYVDGGNSPTFRNSTTFPEK